MLTATDGFGLATSFSYVALTQNNYTKYASLAYPDQDYQGPLYVVASMTAPTGIASPTSYTQSFWYWGAALNLQGRGSEGFYARRVIDNRDSLQHYDYYRRDFPYIGLTFQSDVYQTDGATLLSRVQNAPASSSFGAGYETRYFPYVSSATSDRYELGGTRNGAWLQRDSMSVGIDGYGNATSLTTSSQDKDSASPWVGETFTQVTTNTITNDAVNWCLGRPTQTTLQSTLPDTTSQTRTQGATIDYPNCRATQSVIEPASSTLKVTTTYGFDGCGNVNSIQVVGKKPDGTDMPTRTTGLNYGTRCQFPETLTNALSESTTIAYKYEFGVQSSVTDPNGLARSFLYDDFGRKTRDTRPDSTYTTWTPGSCDASNSYCGVSDLRSYFTEAQYTTGGSLIRSAYLYYDGLDRLRYNEQRNLAGGLTNSVTLYDAFGRTSVQYMPYSSSLTGTRQWSYDALSRVTADALYTAGGSLDRQTTYAYTGRYVAITDPRANVTQRYLDVRGQLRRLVDASPGGTTSYTFDHFGNLTSATDPAGNVTSAGYNLRGFVTSTSDVDRGTWTYTPNSLGEVLSQTDAKSQTVTMTFDALSRPLTRVETEGTSTWTWGALADNTPSNKYVGRLKALSGPGYSESFVFDSLGRPQTTTYAADTSYQVDYTFDATTGYLDNVTYPTSTASYRLRAQYLYTYGILSQVRDFNAPSTVWWQLNAIDDRGNPVDEQLANGVHVLANNDGLTGHLNWRTSGTNASSWNNQQNLTYAWDKNENLKDRIDVNQSSLTEHFEYDALNRLDYSTLNGVTNLDVTLDAIGNITYRSDVGSYTYHATRKHALASTGAPTNWSFTYDNNGNMQTGRGATINWTSYNLPASISNGSLSSTFSYTPDRRYWKQVAQYSGGPETTIYIGGILEKSSGATTTDYKHFIRAGSATVIVTRSTGSNNNTYYVTADSLGSSASITNSAGSQVLNESFAAYGARRGSNWTGVPTSGDMTTVASTTRRGYTGHTMLDNLMLIHMNGRMLDPMIGRFLSTDPIVDGANTSQGYDRMSYVANNPLALVDPSGYAQRDTNPPLPINPPPPNPVALGPGINVDAHKGTWDSSMYASFNTSRGQGSTPSAGASGHSANGTVPEAKEPKRQEKCGSGPAVAATRDPARPPTGAEASEQVEQTLHLASGTVGLGDTAVKTWEQAATRGSNLSSDLKILGGTGTVVAIGANAFELGVAIGQGDRPTAALHIVDLSVLVAGILYPPVLPYSLGYLGARAGGDLFEFVHGNRSSLLEQAIASDGCH
jgi:RHS repeat-associated protein